MVDVTISGDRAIFTVTDAPGLFATGTFYDTTKTIVVSLEHERYKKLIVEVADPDGTARTLNAALGR